MHEGLEKIRQKIARVREVLYNAQSTEFIIVTIPTVKATTPFATAMIVILCYLYLYSVIAYGVGNNLDKYHSS
jgi:anion-transporting  ArsA/GET3 family ATPase